MAVFCSYDADGPNLSEESNDEEEEASRHSLPEQQQPMRPVSASSSNTASTGPTHKSVVDEDLQSSDEDSSHSNDESSSGSDSEESDSSCSENEEEEEDNREGGVEEEDNSSNPCATPAAALPPVAPAEDGQDSTGGSAAPTDAPQGKSSQDTKPNIWNLGYLFQTNPSDESEMTATESKQSSSAPNSSSKNYNGERRSGRNASQRSPRGPPNTSRHKAASTLWESSEEETPPTKPRPTPRMILALPRTAENKSPSSSDSSDSEEEPCPPNITSRSSHSRRAEHRQIPEEGSKLPSGTASQAKSSASTELFKSDSKSGAANKGKRGRKKGVRGGVKSKEHVPTDSSDSDNENAVASKQHPDRGRRGRKTSNSTSTARPSPANPALSRYNKSHNLPVETAKVSALSSTAQPKSSNSSKNDKKHVADESRNGAFPVTKLLSNFKNFEFPAANNKAVKPSTKGDKNKRECLANVFHGAFLARGKSSNNSQETEKDRKKNTENISHKRDGSTTPSEITAAKKMKASHSTSSKPSEGRKRKREEAHNVLETSDSSTEVASPEVMKRSKRQSRSTNSKSKSGKRSAKSSAAANTPRSEECDEEPKPSNPPVGSRVPIPGESPAAFESRQSTLSACPTPSNSNVTRSPANIASGRTPQPISTPPPPPTSQEDQYSSSRGSRLPPPPLSTDNNLYNVPRAIPASFVKNIPRPADFAKKFPIMASLEGKNVKDIFRELFGRDVVNIRGEYGFLDQAKKLKRIADEMDNDRTLQGTKYLEAVLYFILSGLAMESDVVTTPAAVTMYNDTTMLIAWVSSVFHRSHRTNPYNQHHYQSVSNWKLAVLCFLCQSALSLKVYTMRMSDIADTKSFVQEYFSRTTKDPRGHAATPASASQTQNNNSNNNSNTAATGGGSNRVAGSPPSISPTPSPAGSVGSDSSHSSGYLTSNERRPQATNGVAVGGSAAPSPSGATLGCANGPPNKFEMTEAAHLQVQKYCRVTSFLSSGLDFWLKAQKLIEEHQLEGEFFFFFFFFFCCSNTFESIPL